MQVSLKLHAPYDLDLIALRAFYKVRFPQLIRNCLNSCIEQGDYVLSVPDDLNSFLYYPEHEICMNLRLYEKTERRFIEYLRTLPFGSRNSIIKLFIRSCYNRFPLELYITCIQPISFLEKGSVLKKEPILKTNRPHNEEIPTITKQTTEKKKSTIHIPEELSEPVVSSSDSADLIDFRNLFNGNFNPDFSNIR